LVGTAVLKWFRQLRRIQSYCHAIKANKNHAEAVIYRTELWTAIRKSNGFSPDFPGWWEQQEFVQAVGILPLQPPAADLAVLIYEAFHHAFRAFERWHLGQKNRAIQLKYDKSHAAI
jgi:hypothetical protein